MRFLNEVICDTSVIQYLHQIELLSILPRLAATVVLPPAVMRELDSLNFTGTLGLLVAAKRLGMIPTVKEYLERLQGLGFRFSVKTRFDILNRAGELS